jgi:hypothetical protein
MRTSDEPPASGVAELLGRRVACAELEDALFQAREGRGAWIVVEGAAGIGKTTVATWAAARAAELGFEVGWGRCDADAATPSLGPWLQLALAHERALDGDAADEWHRSVDWPRDDAPVDERAGDDATAVRTDRLDRWRDAWTAEADRRPLLLVLDDIHWADVASLLLLASLARVVAAHPIVVLATARTGDAVVPRVEQPLAQVRSLARAIPLGGLPAEAVAELTRAAGLPDDPALVDILRERTGANPFFLHELLAVLPLSGGPGGVRRIAATEVPVRVSEVVQRRLARLRTSTAELLSVAAVLGAEGDVPTLAAVAELPVEDAMERLEPAVEAQLVEELPSGRWRFAHALVRDAIHETLPLRQRHALHDRAAAVIDAQTAGAAHAELARHALAALPVGDVDRAATFAAAAARDALAAMAHEEAAELAQRGLDSGPSTPSLRLDLLLTLGDARRAAGHISEARAAYRQVADDPAVGPEPLARAALGFADPGADLGIAYQASDPATGDLLQAALAASGPADSVGRVRLLARLAAELYFSSQPERSRPLADDALAMADRLGDPRAQLAAGAVHHDAFVVGQATPAEALAGSARLAHLARLAGDRRSLLVAHRARVLDLLAAGELVAADAEISAFSRIAAELAAPAYGWWPALWRAMRALLEGRHDDAEALAAAAIELAGDTFAGLAGTNFAFLLFFVRREQGRLAELEPAVRAFAAEQADIPAIAPSWALLLAELGRRDEASGVLARLAADDFARLHDRNWPVSWFQLARAAYLAADRAAAEALASAGGRLAGGCVMVSLGTALLGSIDLGLAWTADALDKFDEADEWYRRAEATNLRLGAVPWLALARVDHAHLLARRSEEGDPGDARRLAASALDAAGALPPIATRATALLDQLDRAPSGSAPSARGRFRRAGSSWELAYGGRQVVVPHAKGLVDLAVLLARPGEPVHALELVSQQADEVLAPVGSDEILDRRARQEIAARLAELEGEADEADLAHDLERATRARTERDELVDSLARAVGLGGRSRRLDDPAERARKTVTARIRNSIKRLDTALPELAVHLDRSIDTGLWCVYQPERPTTWEL